MQQECYAFDLRLQLLPVGAVARLLCWRIGDLRGWLQRLSVWLLHQTGHWDSNCVESRVGTLATVRVCAYVGLVCALHRGYSWMLAVHSAATHDRLASAASTADREHSPWEGYRSCAPAE